MKISQSMIPMVFLLFPAAFFAGQDKGDQSLARAIAGLDPNLVAPTSEEGKALRQMLAKDVRARRDEVNLRESRAWRKIKTRTDWEAFRDVRLQALKASLGRFPPVPRDLKIKVTGEIKGDGFLVRNLVFESRPGLWVTGNLYLPDPPVSSMPGILICHSHHNPKTQGELQDMGMNWALVGCAVLVMDQLGHGERRQHPFSNAKKYAGAFKVGRQDYYFRYNLGMQLHLAGESLIGWMVWDLMRGVDVLLKLPGTDKDRIILLGAVAGGGDPCAVTAALDNRIAAAVPFNFGGPQPETRFPLPDEDAFNYAGGGSWESTRNLRLSARDGFLPWVIVGGIAPRRLVYAHEFSWDQVNDPVWKRLEKIYDFYEARDNLAFAAGRGKLSGKPPESTHCNNIGPVHRKPIYAAFKKWFGIPIIIKEYQKRIPSEDLQCLPKSGIRMTPMIEVLENMVVSEERGKNDLRKTWSGLLGPVEPEGVQILSMVEDKLPRGIRLLKIRLRTLAERRGGRIEIPMLLLLPPGMGKNFPVVVGIAQAGKQGFLKNRAEVVAGLLQREVAVCLPDLRGTGETLPGDGSRGRQSTATGISATELMLGHTMVGNRLADLRTVLGILAALKDIDAKRIALWGDSFAPVNAEGKNIQVPWDASPLPAQCEPLGGVLATLGALYEPNIRAVYARGGLASYSSLLKSQFVFVPHDAVVPGALTAGDLTALAASLAPRPMRLEGLVDGVNRMVKSKEMEMIYRPVRDAYRKAGASSRFLLREGAGNPAELVDWLVSSLK